MKLVLISLVGLGVLVVGGLFIAGVVSKSGAPAGIVDGRLSACPSSPNCVSSEAGTDPDKLVEALPLDTWTRLPMVLSELGAVLTVQEEGYLAAEVTSRVFQFTDDVEFRLADDAIHMRSASRVGYSDAGANRARVEALRTLLSAR